MTRIEQYPHYLFILETTETYRDDDGNWIPGSTELRYIGKCREETNGKGSQIQLAGGVFHTYSSLVQLPKGTRKISEGAIVKITNDQLGEDERIQGEVMKFDQGQLHSRLWV